MGQRGVSNDPICGKAVVEEGAESLEYKRKTYYFCSHSCRSRFEREAERIRIGELARLGALFAQRKAHWGLA